MWLIRNFSVNLENQSVGKCKLKALPQKHRGSMSYWCNDGVNKESFQFVGEIENISVCLYWVIETFIQVWENSKRLWKHSPTTCVPIAFLILPDLTETQKMRWYFLNINQIVQPVHFVNVSPTFYFPTLFLFQRLCEKHSCAEDSMD